MLVTLIFEVFGISSNYINKVTCQGILLYIDTSYVHPILIRIRILHCQFHFVAIALVLWRFYLRLISLSLPVCCCLVS